MKTSPCRLQGQPSGPASAAAQGSSNSRSALRDSRVLDAAIHRAALTPLPSCPKPRNRSGEGLPCSTSSPEEIRPSKRGYRLARARVNRILSWPSLEAMQVGTVIWFYASAMSRLAVSPRVKAVRMAWSRSSFQPGGTGRPSPAVIAARVAGMPIPRKSRTQASWRSEHPTRIASRPGPAVRSDRCRARRRRSRRSRAPSPQRP